MIRALTLIALVAPSVALSQTCTPVTFADGFTAGTIEGEAPADGAMCYMLDMSGHDGNLALTIEGENVMFGYQVADLSDDQITQVEMFPAQAAVEIRVSQQAAGEAPAPFRLNIEAKPPS